MMDDDPWPPEYEERGLCRLMLRWPGRRVELRGQRDRSAFMLLCAAYHAAHSAAEQWSHADDEHASLRVDEFRTLASTIEHDIEAIFLSSSAADCGGTRTN